MTEKARVPFGFTILVVFGFVALFGLGSWQLSAHFWQREVADIRASRLDQPPVPLAGDMGMRLEYVFTVVEARGVFRHDLERVVRLQSFDDEPGLHVVTPLELDDGSTLFIDRGWVPYQRDLPEAKPVGEVAVVGALKPPGLRGLFKPRNDPAGGTWYAIDPKAMGRALNLERVRPYFLEEGPVTEKRLPRPGYAPYVPDDTNLYFAIGWFVMAAGMVLIWFERARKARKEAQGTTS